VAGVAIGSDWMVRNLVLDRLKTSALMKVEQSGQEVDTWLAQRLGEVQVMANSQAVRSGDWATAEPYLQLEQDRLGDFWMFVWAQPDGSYYTTRNGFATGQNLRDRSYFQKTLKGEANVSNMVISRTTGKRQINIAAPVWSFPPANYAQLPADRRTARAAALASSNIPAGLEEKPVVISSLTGNIPVSQVSHIVEKTNSGSGSYAFALDADGVPIAHPNPAMLTGLQSFLKSDNAALSSIAQDMVARQRGVKLIQLDGQWVYVAYSPLDRAPWSMALVIPRGNLERQLDALNLLAGVVGALLLVATLLTLRQIRLFEEMRDRAEHETRLNLELHQTGAELQDTLAYLSAIIDNLADGLLVANIDGTITRYNPALVQLFGVEAQVQGNSRLLSQGLSDLIAQTQQRPQEVLTADLPLAGDRIGKAVATSITKSTDSTLPIATVVLIRDITAERVVDQMKTDFISTVSHELRTPLTSVLGFAKLIKKRFDEVVVPVMPQDDKKLNRAVRQINDNLDIIVSEGQRLTSLINDVLDIAKMEAGKVDWRRSPLAMEEVVNRAIAATDALFQTKQIPVVKEIAPDLPTIEGDCDRLIQVVINLLSNAVKFTDQGCVTCRLRQEEGSIVLRVIDTGMGIAPEDQPKVFEKFKQVGDTMTDKPKGTGLGLPICKQIVEHHQGQIWVESDPGQGSTFAFSIPVLERPIDQVRELDFQTLLQKLQAQVPTNHSSGERSQKRVLVVDDEPMIRQLLRQHLEAEGYQVLEAQDGREAVQQVKLLKPDLIILDLMMPELSGFDAAAVLKNDPETMGIPLVILSILADQERAQRLGDRCLTKPINAELLLHEVEVLISQGSSHRRILVVDQNEHTVKTLVEVLKAKGFSVAEALNDAELLQQTVDRPDIVIANSQFWQQSTAVQALKLEKGLENVLLLLIAEDSDGKS
jgi:signal transduction histidine kinase/CheY-like chemotaxis protein